MSKVSLCNQALRRVGEQTIQSLDEESKNAKLCNEMYDQTVEEVLRAHNWNCALFRTELAQDSTYDKHGWEYAYPLPNNPKCLRVLRMEDTEYEWVIEGRMLKTDEGTAKILYLGNPDDPDDLDPLCRKVIYLELALAMAYSLVENGTLLNVIAEQLGKAWSDARGFDANEGTRMEAHKSVWLDSRRQGINAGQARNNVR